MYTLLVVDDEKLAREDILYHVGTSGFQFEWIMEAENFDEALEIVKANRPDIMITDILMGEKSGLDLLEETNKLCPEMVSAIICGYPDFSFAKRAIGLNVIDYLLKPVKIRELQTLLTKMTAEIDHRKMIKQISSENYVLQQDFAGQKLREEINAFISGSEGYGINRLRALLPKNAKWFQVQFIRIKKLNGGYDEWDLPENSNNPMAYGMQNLIEEIGGGNILSGRSTENGRMIVAFATSEKTLQEDAKREILTKVNKIRTEIEAGLDIEIEIALSLLTDGLNPFSVVEAQKAMDMRFCEPNRGIYQFSDYDIGNTPTFRSEEIEIFRKCLGTFDIKIAQMTVKKLIQSYKDSRYTDIRETYNDVIRIIMRSCYKKGVSIIQLLGAENISGYILEDFERIDEVADNLGKIISAAMGSWVNEMKSTSDVLEDIKSFIDENFTDSELCTNQLSEKFCISLGYLSASYKKAYGITVSKYIISKRLGYAAKLLTSTDYSLDSISESSGFNNLSYFMRSFKNFYKMTPKQYRQSEHVN